MSAPGRACCPPRGPPRPTPLPSSVLASLLSSGPPLALLPCSLPGPHFLLLGHPFLLCPLFILSHYLLTPRPLLPNHTDQVEPLSKPGPAAGSTSWPLSPPFLGPWDHPSTDPSLDFWPGGVQEAHVKAEPQPAPWAGNYAAAPLPFSEHWLPRKGPRVWAAVGLTLGTRESSLFDSYPAFPEEICWPQEDFARWPLLLQSHACGRVSSHLHLCVRS